MKIFNNRYNFQQNKSALLPFDFEESGLSMSPSTGWESSVLATADSKRVVMKIFIN
jgi:hypothetical protein